MATKKPWGVGPWGTGPWGPTPEQIGDLTDTRVLTKPVNCQLHDYPKWEMQINYEDLADPNYGYDGTTSRSGVKSLGGKSTFTVKTSNRGY